jgi:hypothetical protein
MENKDARDHFHNHSGPICVVFQYWSTTAGDWADDDEENCESDDEVDGEGDRVREMNWTERMKDSNELSIKR